MSYRAEIIENGKLSVAAIESNNDNEAIALAKRNFGSDLISVYTLRSNRNIETIWSIFSAKYQ